MLMYMMAARALLFTLSSSSSSRVTSLGTHPDLTASSLPSNGTHSSAMTEVAPSNTAGSSWSSRSFTLLIASHASSASTAGSRTPDTQHRNSSSAILERPISSSVVLVTSRGKVLECTSAACTSTLRAAASTSALYAASRTSMHVSSSIATSLPTAPSCRMLSQPAMLCAVISSAAAARSRTVSSSSSSRLVMDLQIPASMHCTALSPVARSSEAARSPFCLRTRSSEESTRTILGKANFSNPRVMVCTCWILGLGRFSKAVMWRPLASKANSYPMLP
mmetsp:Transcript_48298/g.92376  ORF Transcript_48298/g.92376 Transcript_48298/m.92376 type:complete len:278 (-) Transcript_48298:6-839(-)